MMLRLLAFDLWVLVSRCYKESRTLSSRRIKRQNLRKRSRTRLPMKISSLSCTMAKAMASAKRRISRMSLSASMGGTSNFYCSKRVCIRSTVTTFHLNHTRILNYSRIYQLVAATCSCGEQKNPSLSMMYVVLWLCFLLTLIYKLKLE